MTRRLLLESVPLLDTLMTLAYPLWAGRTLIPALMVLVGFTRSVMSAWSPAAATWISDRRYQSLIAAMRKDINGPGMPCISCRSTARVARSSRVRLAFSRHFFHLSRSFSVAFAIRALILA